MGPCSFCIPALVTPSTLPSLHDTSWKDMSNLPTTPPRLYLQVDPHQAELAEATGLGHHSGLESLIQCAKECFLCALMLKNARALIQGFRDLENLNESEAYAWDRVKGHGLPPTWVFRLTKRPDGAEGFIVLVNSKLKTTMYILAVIGFCAEEKSPIGKLQGIKVDTYAGCEATLNLAAKWIDDCSSNHDCCTAPAESMPSRVLDLDMAKISGQIRLHKTDKNSRSPYIALSHCWGGGIPRHAKTTRNTLQDRMLGFGIGNLPRTFQDAIKITCYLGIRYLWIDSLCICQDDVDDWAREAATMADVYAGAHVVIAADTAREAAQGFLTRTPRGYIHVDLIEAPPMGTKTSIVRALAFESPPLPMLNSRYWTEFRDEPLTARAWAFQERILPHRILHFTTQQLFFECNRHFVSEDGLQIQGRLNSLYPGPHPSFDNINRSSAVSKTHYLWYLLIHAFTARNLTFRTDRFPAIAGIAKIIRERIVSQALSDNTQYVAGLWSDSLVEGLTWVSDAGPNESITFPDELPLAGEEGYIAPTWSWASYPYGTDHGLMGDSYSSVATPTGWGVTLKNKLNPYGEVLDGWISLKAPLLKLELSNKYPLRLCTPGGDHHYYPFLDGLNRRTTKAFRIWMAQKEFYAVVLMKGNLSSCDEPEWRYRALIVIETGRRKCDRQGKEYRRVGVMWLRCDSLGRDEEKVINDPERFVDITIV